MPRKSCARMSPLLPRAPSSAARAMLLTVSAKVEAGCASSCSSMLRRVNSMLVPVSPSGTGNTLRAFRTLRFASMTVVEARMSPRSVCVAYASSSANHVVYRVVKSLGCIVSRCSVSVCVVR